MLEGWWKVASMNAPPSRISATNWKTRVNEIKLYTAKVTKVFETEVRMKSMRGCFEVKCNCNEFHLQFIRRSQ